MKNSTHTQRSDRYAKINFPLQIGSVDFDKLSSLESGAHTKADRTTHQAALLA